MAINTEDQAKLHSERQQQLDKSSEYIKSFRSKLVSSDAYKTNNCPTCDNPNPHYLFTKNGGEYAYCPNCEHVFLRTSLKHEYLIDFYSNYPTSSLDWHKNESEFYTNIYTSGLDLISKVQPSGNILDIGCSSGFFLSLAQQFGYQAYGIEPNILESEFATANQINILGKTIDDIHSSMKFDVITMWDVLEHIDSPVKYISKLTSYLNPGGTIFVQIPTSDSLAAKIMRDKCNMFDGIEHLTLFSKKSLQRCFAQSSFSLAEYKSVISDQFAISNYLAYEVDPYLPDHPDQNMSFSNLLHFNSESIEASSLGYKIQACFVSVDS